MKTPTRASQSFEDIRISVQVKLSALWTSLMFLYIYVDYFALYMPGKLENILKGKVFVFDISQGFLLAALVSMSIPAIMIFLSVALPPLVNRWVNIVIGVLFIPYTLFNLAGEAWVHMIFAAVIEVALLCIIVYEAWNWPRVGQ